MTYAVCFCCGQEKGSAFVPCSACGARPVSEDDLVLSLGLTDHYNEIAQVRRFGELIAAGTPLRLDPSTESKLREDIRAFGLGSKLDRMMGSPESQTTSIHPDPSIAGWKSVRIFISSTFSDMHAERDYLVRAVFPKVRLWCEQRGIELLDIDLRWGVTREEAEDGRALDICLREIDRSRPFFLCLLGERYGWVPANVCSDEFRLHDSHSDRSITHLEIEHAVRAPIMRNDSTEQRLSTRAFFYFRQPRCVPRSHELDALSVEQCRLHDQTFFEVDARRVEQLATLKSDLRGFYRNQDRVRSYAGHWNPSAQNPEQPDLIGRLEELSEFGGLVEADLTRGIDEEFHDHIRDITSATPSEREIRAHAAFAQRRRLAYVERSELERRVTDYVRGDSSVALMLLGAQGSGKSSLLSWLVERWRPEIRVVCRFIGATPGAKSVTSVWVSVFEELCGSAQDDPQTVGTVPVDLAGIRERWHDVLERATAERPLAIILDGIERYPPGEILSLMEVVSLPRPASVRILLSGAVRQDSERDLWIHQLRRARPVEIEVGDLTDEECGALVRRFPSVFCKTLDRNQIELLLQNRATRSPLFLATVLEELRVFGSFGRLEQRLVDFPWLAPAPNQGQKVVCGRIEDALKVLYDQVLTRIVADLPVVARRFAAELFGFLGCSWDGLTEKELAELVASSTGHADVRAASEWIQIVLRQMREHLERKYTSGAVTLDFSNPILRRAACERFIESEEVKRGFRVRLAGYFSQQPLAPTQRDPFPVRYSGDQMKDHVDHVTPRVYSTHGVRSWLWQLTELGDWLGIQEAVSTPAVFQALWEIDERQAAQWWHGVEANLGTGMVEGMASIIKNPDDYCMRLLWAVGRLLSENGHPESAVGIQQILVRRTKGIGPGDVLAVSNLAATLSRMGSDEEALRLLETTCAGQEATGRGFILAPVLLAVGRTLLDRDDSRRALTYLRRATLVARQGGVFTEMLGETLQARAIAHARLGELEQAIRCAAQSTTAFRRQGKPELLAQALRTVGMLWDQVSETAKAIEALDEAAVIYASVGDQRSVREMTVRLDELRG